MSASKHTTPGRRLFFSGKQQVQIEPFDVGAHDGHEIAEWTTATITKLFLALAASGRFSLEGLNTYFFKPTDCAHAYETVNRERARTMGVVFDWREEA